jgi:hypothetical protein
LTGGREEEARGEVAAAAWSQRKRAATAAAWGQGGREEEEEARGEGAAAAAWSQRKRAAAAWGQGGREEEEEEEEARGEEEAAAWSQRKRGEAAAWVWGQWGDERAAAARKTKVNKVMRKLIVGSRIQIYMDVTDYEGRYGAIRQFNDTIYYQVYIELDDEKGDLFEVDLMIVYDFDAIIGKKSGDDEEYDDKESDSEDEESSTINNKNTATTATNEDKDDAIVLLKSLRDKVGLLSRGFEESKAKKLSATKDNKRPIASRAQSVEQMEDETVRRVHDTAVKFVEQVQFVSQFKLQADRDHHPPFWTIMMNVDRLIPDPNKPEAGGRKERHKPVVNMFAQPPELAGILKKAAKNMLKGRQEGWTVATTSEEYNENTFGPRANSVPKKHHTIAKAMQEEKVDLLKETEGEAAAALKENQTQNPHLARNA